MVRLARSPLESLRAVKMKKLLLACSVVVIMSMSSAAQEKGVDPQTDRVRDNGTERAPAANGAKQDTGAGRGINFGAGRTPETPIIPNPYRFTARRDALIEAAKSIMNERGLILDEAASRQDEGVFITQPYTFTKGAVVSQSELNRYTELPPSTGRGWTRGRYTLIIEIQAIDAVSANVTVTTKMEGRTDGATGAEWSTLRSSGLVEQEILGELIGRITGVSPLSPTP